MSTRDTPRSTQEEKREPSKHPEGPVKRPAIVEESDLDEDNVAADTRARDSAVEESFSIDHDDDDVEDEEDAAARTQHSHRADDNARKRSVNLDAVVDAIALMAIADGVDPEEEAEAAAAEEENDKSAADRPTTADAQTGPDRPAPPLSEAATLTDAPGLRPVHLPAKASTRDAAVLAVAAPISRRDAGTDAGPLPPPEVQRIVERAPAVSCRDAATDAMPLPPREVQRIVERTPAVSCRDAATDAMPLPPPEVRIVERVVERFLEHPVKATVAQNPSSRSRDVSPPAFTSTSAGSTGVSYFKPPPAKLERVEVIGFAEREPCPGSVEPTPDMYSLDRRGPPQSVFPTEAVVIQTPAADKAQRALLFASDSGSGTSPPSMAEAGGRRRMQLRTNTIQLRSRSLQTTSSLSAPLSRGREHVCDSPGWQNLRTLAQPPTGYERDGIVMARPDTYGVSLQVERCSTLPCYFYLGRGSVVQLSFFQGCFWGFSFALKCGSSSVSCFFLRIHVEPWAYADCALCWLPLRYLLRR
jgi:hypothetical protein